MRIFASKHDMKGPVYIAATLCRSELVDAIAKAGMPDCGGMVLENCRFDGDLVTVELARATVDGGSEHG